LHFKVLPLLLNLFDEILMLFYVTHQVLSCSNWRDAPNFGYLCFAFDGEELRSVDPVFNKRLEKQAKVLPLMQEKREQLMRLPLQTLLRLPLECLVKLLYSLSLLLRRSHLLLRLPNLAIRSALLGLLGLIFLVADDVADGFVLELSQLSLFFLLLFL